MRGTTASTPCRCATPGFVLPEGEPMHPFQEHRSVLTRRQLFGRAATGIGTVALASLLNEGLLAEDRKTSGALPALHFAPRARRVISLFMSGGPSQLDLF